MKREASPREFKYGIGEIDPSREYYAVTLTADESGKIWWTTTTHWVGFTDGKPRLEIRRASLVGAKTMARNWSLLRETFVIVNATAELACFVGIMGGHALVEKSLAERHLPDVIRPSDCAPEAPFGGVISESSIPKDSLRRFPRPPKS